MPFLIVFNTLLFFQCLTIPGEDIFKNNKPKGVFLAQQSEQLTSSDSSMRKAWTTKKSLSKNLPLYFVENIGQFHGNTFFCLESPNQWVHFTRKGIRLTLRKGSDSPFRQWGLAIDFVGANSASAPQGLDPQKASFSYFLGKKEDWKVGAPSFGGIIYPDLWPGIDLVYYGCENRLKYEFRVKPGADPEQIRLVCRGAAKAQVLRSGAIRFETPMGCFEDGAPYVFQEGAEGRETVHAAYNLNETSVPGIFQYGFDVGEYDTSRVLVLDPVVILYCGYIEAGYNSWHDRCHCVAMDSDGYAYVGGRVEVAAGGQFPVKVGPDLTYNDHCDAFVAKVTPDGSDLVYCGFIGGYWKEWINGIAVDGSGAAYVVGFTESPESSFPVTVGPDLTFNGSGWEHRDAFVAKVNPMGTHLDYCGYIGGDAEDRARDVAVDESGAAYVAGYTFSPEATFPVVLGPGLTHKGAQDGFIAKVHPSGGHLLYCGYVGGNADETCNGIAVDASENAYVAGWTSSTESSFPVINGPDLTHNGGVYDGYIAKVIQSGAGLEYCGYLGGSEYDEARHVATDQFGYAYLTGRARSTEADFPVSVGPYLTHSGDDDAFVAKVNPGGVGLSFCGFIGGTDWDMGLKIGVDDSNYVYVMGNTTSDETSFPVLDGPDLTYNGLDNVFVARLNGTGDLMHFCGYIGGDESDSGLGLAVHNEGIFCVAGLTNSTQNTFPVAVGPDITHSGFQNDAFVAKLQAPLPTVIELVSFQAKGVARKVRIIWKTASEMDTAGFHLWRRNGAKGKFFQITDKLIPSKGGPSQGAEYLYIDDEVRVKKGYAYRLEDLDYMGNSTFYRAVFADW